MDSIFKTQVQKDLVSVFFNVNEFGETHNINGVDGVPSIFDSDMTQALRPGLGRYEGTFKENIMLFVQESDMPNKPVFNQFMIVDKMRYRILRVDLFNGLYEISLEAVK